MLGASAPFFYLGIIMDVAIPALWQLAYFVAGLVSGSFLILGICQRF